MDSNINRVYVNPNFNRTSNVAAFVSNHMYTNNQMHVNPNFARQIPNTQQNTNLNRRIYVNPNFIKPGNISKPNYMENETELHYNNTVLKNYNYSTPDNSCPPSKIENSKPALIPSSKSRYHFVRKTDNLLVKEHKTIESGTIKISKYKSIPIHKFKNDLQTVNDTIAKQKVSCSVPVRNTTISIPIQNTNIVVQKCVNKSSFKYIKRNINPAINVPLKLTPRTNLLKTKRNIDLSLSIKLKDTNGSKRKNNIPCRLFTKYGKCIRNLSGTCQYLHDKKHVSLCRKFIKGICHDKNCLLSHELSSKKMPTCSFYLKGMCTKNDCPYLHVKLSEKSKVCLDFLKGYCDKGDLCTHKHIRPHMRKKIGNELLDRNANKNKDNRTKVNIFKLVNSNQFKRLNAQIEVDKVEEAKRAHSSKEEQEKTDSDCRYFREDNIQNENVICEILQPMRCKLGTLPSFIQL